VSEARALSWQVHRSWAEERLRAAGIREARTEARFLVETASGFTQQEWLESRDTAAPERAVDHLRAMVDRRIAGEPLQYVLGEWTFRNIELMVDRRVLIPRPETEVVVDVAVAAAKRAGVPARHGLHQAMPDEPEPVVDLGTGSGAIALALAAELLADVWATDRADNLLAVARANAAGNALANVRFATGDWFDALPVELGGRLRLAVSNPPYVSEAEHRDLDPIVRDHEPRDALVAGPTGREHLEHLVDAAYAWLAPGGALVLELAPHQADRITAAAHERGYEDVGVHVDLAGRQRVLSARRPA
jgi:release factor glutamine methyltransferase